MAGRVRHRGHRRCRRPVDARLARTVSGHEQPPGRRSLLGAAILYALIAVVAISPSVLGDLGINLNGLQVEAILVSIQVFLGVNVAWLLMFDEVTD